MKHGQPDTGTLSHLLALTKGYMPARVFLTALELDLFGAIGDEPMTADDLAERIQADPQATDILLNALVALGLLGKDDDRFVNLDPMAGLLTPGRPEYVGDGLRYAVRLWPAWSRLTETVRTGHPVAWERTEAFAEDTAQAMRLHAAGVANALAKAVDCAGAARMLDLGGGAGTHAIAFARRYRQLDVVLLDINESALAIAKAESERLDLQDRVRVAHGDMLADDLGGDYDIVLLASVLCTFSEAENQQLLKRARASLRSGGRLVVCDALLDASLTRPAASALFAVHMLITTPNGRAYSVDQVTRWLRDAGFPDVCRIPLPKAHVIIARATEP